MTDCDVTDATLNEVATFALAHLPAGSEAHVERGRSGMPHMLHVRAVGLDVDHLLFWGEPRRGGSISCQFYDRLAPVRWLMSNVERAAIGARRAGHELEAKGVKADDIAPVWAMCRELGDLAGRLMSERHRLEREGAALAQTPLYRNVVSAETCREMGVSPDGEASQ